MKRTILSAILLLLLAVIARARKHHRSRNGDIDLRRRASDRGERRNSRERRPRRDHRLRRQFRNQRRRRFGAYRISHGLSCDYREGFAAELRVVLQEDNKLLDEVVVVGYQVQRKVDVTGAITAVDVRRNQQTE